jgi:chemotaxis protein histidine kinase CheA
VGVVDHEDQRGAVEVDEGVGQEDLAVEALESGIALEEQHPRIA